MRLRSDVDMGTHVPIVKTRGLQVPSTNETISDSMKLAMQSSLLRKTSRYGAASASIDIIKKRQWESGYYDIDTREQEIELG